MNHVLTTYFLILLTEVNGHSSLATHSSGLKPVISKKRARSWVYQTWETNYEHPLGCLSSDSIIKVSSQCKGAQDKFLGQEVAIQSTHELLTRWVLKLRQTSGCLRSTLGTTIPDAMILSRLSSSIKLRIAM